MIDRTYPYNFDLFWYSLDEIGLFDPLRDFLLHDGFVVWRHVQQYAPGGGAKPFAAVRPHTASDEGSGRWVIALKGAFINRELPGSFEPWFDRQIEGRLVMFHDHSDARGLLKRPQNITDRMRMVRFMERFGFKHYGYVVSGRLKAPVSADELKQMFVRDFMQLQDDEKVMP